MLHVMMNKQAMHTCKLFIEYWNNHPYGLLWLNVKNCGWLSSAFIWLPKNLENFNYQNSESLITKNYHRNYTHGILCYIGKMLLSVISYKYC